MSAEIAKQLRIDSLLRILEVAHPAGVTLTRLTNELTLVDAPVTQERVHKDLQGLISQGHVRQVPDPFSPALKYYHITDQGIAAR